MSALKPGRNFSTFSNMAMQTPTDKEDAIGMIIQVLNDQLGIKIDQKKVAAEVIVVERAEKIPVEN